MAFRWLCTVFWVMPSSRATCLVLRPSAIICRISVWRSDSRSAESFVVADIQHRRCEMRAEHLLAGDGTPQRVEHVGERGALGEVADRARFERCSGALGVVVHREHHDRTSGNSSTIRRVALTPSSTGMDRSISTMSGMV